MKHYRRRTSPAVKLLVILFAVCAAVAARDCIRYLNGVPQITPRDLTVQPETVLSIGDMASYDSVTEKRITAAEWTDGCAWELEISPDKQSLEIGAHTGQIKVTVAAVGTVSEWRSADILVTVAEPAS